MEIKDEDLPPLPEWSKCDDLGGLLPSEVRQAIHAAQRAAIEKWVADHGDDAARLGWVASTGAGVRIDQKRNGWYLDVMYHTGISCVDDYKRFPTYREAIDAAMKGTKQ